MSGGEYLGVQVADVLVWVSSERRLLVHASADRLDPRSFGRVVRLVVAGEVLDARAEALRKDCPGVARVADVALVLDDQEDAGAGAGDVHVVEPRAREPQELLVGPHEAVVDGLRRVVGEGRVVDDVLVQVVAQEVRAGVASVSVEDLAERTLPRRKSRPASGHFFCPPA